MCEKDDYWLSILKHNKGFESPHQWVEYAKRHNFQKIKAKKLFSCSDCMNDIFIPVSQYIYYSTLITLKHCKKCGLFFADTHIDPSVIAQHFENTYKDEFYFEYQRKEIFDYISYLVDVYSPSKGKLLDIGGGQGHLLAKINERRPDLDLALNDLSRKSCNYVRKHYGFKTICGIISNLAQLTDRFDIILLIDVIYYEPDIKRLWNVINNLLNHSGTLIIRVPNKLELIRLNQKLFSAISSRNAMVNPKPSIRFFNPEHIYIFSKSYLEQRLKKIGFSKTIALPSPLLRKSQRRHMDSLYHLYNKVSQKIYKLGLKNLILTPSFIVVAIKRDEIMANNLGFIRLIV